MERFEIKKLVKRLRQAYQDLFILERQSWEMYEKASSPGWLGITVCDYRHALKNEGNTLNDDYDLMTTSARRH